MLSRFITRMISGEIFFRPGIVAAGIALIVTLVTGVFAEHQNRTIYHQSDRAKVIEQLNAIRARLERNMISNIQLVRGLVAVVASHPDIDQLHFSRIASDLIGEHSQLRNIAGAPDLVVSLMYPIKDNEKAIGLDYSKNERQRETALRAVESKQMVLAGPVDLLQGGQGIIARFPVFTDGADGGKNVWGLVSAVIDVERLYADSGLRIADLPIEIAIAGRDATGADGAVFFGRPEVFGNDPVVLEVSLPNSSWRLAAIPRGGWSDASANIWLFRGYILLTGLLVIMPITIAGYLFDQRRHHIRELNGARVLCRSCRNG